MNGMSNVDIAAIVSELKPVLEGSWIRNIYQFNDIFLFKLRSQVHGNITLLVDLGRRIHLTWYQRPKPRLPGNFCMTLRKYLRNRRITGIRQYDFDRLVIIDVGLPEDRYSVIIEFFGDGNIILLDPEGKIFVARHFLRMKDREILPKKEFQFPPTRGADPRSVDFDWMKANFSQSDTDIVRTIARNLNIGGVYAEELCIRAGIDKNTPASSMSSQDFEKILFALKGLISSLDKGEFSPRIVLKNSDSVSVDPFELRVYEGMQFRTFDSFNQAADEFYSAGEVFESEQKVSEVVESEVDRYQRMLEEQKMKIAKMESSEKRYGKHGDLIYGNLNLVKELLETIVSARQRNYSWSEIEEKVREASNRVPSAKIFEELNPKSAKLFVNIEGERIELDYRKSAVENANLFYEQAKKAASKAEGAKKAIQKTLKLIETAEETPPIEITPTQLVKGRKKKWYESFRWFKSSEGVLVLGGRDVKTNTTLYNKHMDPDDLFMHADFRGAPVVIIKKGEKPVSDETIQEAAQFAVSFSSAWKSGWGQADVYWVTREQVSESPPSGEYLERGSFIIRGQRNYVKGVPLKLAVGVIESDDEVLPVCGPPSAIEKQSKNFVIIKPGSIAKGKLAKQIKYQLLKKASPELEEKTNLLPINEIENILPPGGAEISQNS
jgi:predicted ribosome quality control (RQC) complex YloA/Tae2 family protein